MQVEGVDVSILDQDPNGPSPNQPLAVASAETAEPIGAPLLTLKDDPQFSKYFKMLSMHLPRAVVEMKMRADGLKLFEVLDLDPNGPSPNNNRNSNNVNSNNIHSIQQIQSGCPSPESKEDEKKRLVAAAEAKKRKEAEAKAVAAQAAAKAAEDAKMAALPKPTVPTKALYVEKVPSAWVGDTLFGGPFDVLKDSEMVGWTRMLLVFKSQRNSFLGLLFSTFS